MLVHAGTRAPIAVGVTDIMAFDSDLGRMAGIGNCNRAVGVPFYRRSNCLMDPASDS